MGHNDFAYPHGQHKLPVLCVPYTIELCIAISGLDSKSIIGLKLNRKSILGLSINM
ncbi:hypothetical protein GCM10011518_38670 [Flavobacterium limi]|uniref:Uncharacterized protein n=1 Tax=Flavobacterium limi TaxID=2045105 RepID=A0ABQ1USE6_9FLAO|nr:hypothetical protein GCM10011518_38670 [Flavobacterium limi]